MLDKPRTRLRATDLRLAVLDVPALGVGWLGDQDASRVGVRSGASTTNLPQRLRDTLSARVATRGSQRRDGVSGLEIAAARRLGWLLTFVAAEVDLEPLRELAAADEGTPTDLRAGGPRRGPLDRAWNVRVNVQVDPRPVIPKAPITHRAAGAPWPSELQVEQDLIQSRLIVDIANHDLLRPELAFRGGTCLHKLHLPTTTLARRSVDSRRCGVRLGA